MPIPEKELLIGANVTEQGFKNALGEFVDNAKFKENLSLIFDTEIQLKASKPEQLKISAKALDTAKVFEWNRTSTNPVNGTWTDTENSEKEQAIAYTDKKTVGYENNYRDGYSFTVEDEVGRSPLRIDDFGTVEADTLKVKELNGASESSVNAIKALDQNDDFHAFAVTDEDGNAPFAIGKDGTTQALTLKIGQHNDLTVTAESEPYAKAFADEEGNVAVVLHKDGTLEAARIVCNNFVGIDANYQQFKNPYFLAELVYINNAGQSLGQGSNGDVTIVQEYDNVGFPALSVNPTTLIPATVENLEGFVEGWNGDGGRGEFPTLGAMGFIKELIEKENNTTYQHQKYQLATGNNAVSGARLDELYKGTAPYSASISQIQSAKTIAENENRTFKVGAQFWTQGEGGILSSLDYATEFKKYAEDYNADAKAITNQAEDVPLICYQTPTNTASALAQLKVHDLSNLVTIATPIYHLSYYDALHINFQSSKILGCYYGLVYKRTCIDKQEWQPLRPDSHTIQGKVINVRFKVPVEPLVFDTTTVPIQTNFGFYLIDSNRNNIPITSIELINSNSIKIVASTAIPVGAKLKYAVDGSTNMGGYGGSAGNLRDSQGDQIKYQSTPLHNWCVHFEYQL